MTLILGIWQLLFFNYLYLCLIPTLPFIMTQGITAFDYN
jgi:hypothetical protein